MYIFKKSDRIPVRIGDVTFWISPLTSEEKSIVTEASVMDGGEKEVHFGSLYKNYLKHSVKKVHGLKRPDGSAWEPEFDESGNLTDDSLDTILNICKAPLLARAALELYSEIQELDIKGVEVDIKGTIDEKKLESLSQQ